LITRAPDAALGRRAVHRSGACPRVTAPGRLSSGNARVGNAVGSGRLGKQLLMDFIELAVDRCLAFQVLLVQPLDEVSGWLLALEIGVVAVTQ